MAAGVQIGGGIVTLLPGLRLDVISVPLMCHDNEDGMFQIDRVTPGIYYISAEPPMNASFGAGAFAMIEEVSVESPSASHEPHVVFRVRSREQPDRVVVESGDVRGLRVVARSSV